MDIPIATDTLAKYIAGIGLALLIAGGLLVYNTYLTQQQEEIKLEAASSKYSEAELMGLHLDRASVCLIGDNACISEAERKEAKQRQKDEDISNVLSQRAMYVASGKLWRKQFLIGGVMMLLGAAAAGWGFKGWRDAERKEKATSFFG